MLLTQPTPCPTRPRSKQFAKYPARSLKRSGCRWQRCCRCPWLIRAPLNSKPSPIYNKMIAFWGAKGSRLLSGHGIRPYSRIQCLRVRGAGLRIKVVQEDDREVHGLQLGILNKPRRTFTLTCYGCHYRY